MVKVSICVPAYKNPVGVERLLESIKVQSFTDYEVVVTDDSPDGSVEEVVRRAEVPGIVYVRNAVRKGATGNWNEAVRHASGEYIKIMHHDDWFTDRDCLARFVEMLEEHPEADLAFCGSRQVMLDGVGNRTGEEFDRAISDEHLKMMFFHVAVFHDRAGNHRREVAAKQQQLSIVALYRSDFIIDIEQISQKGQRVERNSHGRQQPQMEEFQRAQQTDTKKDSTNKSSQFFLLLFCPVYQNSCAPDSSYSCHRVQN